MFVFGVKRCSFGGEDAGGRSVIHVGGIEETWGVEGGVVVAI